MSKPPDNETRRHILEAAESLFASRGYAAVKLRDIAQAVDMKHASLYYYVPGGKEQLFIEVVEHSYRRHRQGVTEAIQQAGEDLRARLYAVSDWFVTQPAIDLARMQQGDRPKISEAEMARLSTVAYDSLRLPIVEALHDAHAEGQVAVDDVDLAAMALISVIQSIRHIPGSSAAARQQIGHRLVDMMLDGWRPR
jgi:AcrR family transcriptional regulator